MKKNFFLVAMTTALVFAGCSNELVDENIAKSGDNAIGFTTLTNKTRATIVDLANISSFKVSAWSATSEAETDVETGFNHMVGINATRGIDGQTPIGGDETSWSYFPTKYWPKTGTVNFFAYSPAGSVNVISFKNIGGTAASIEYTVPLTTTLGSKTAEDFLVASALNQNAASNATAPGEVTLSFEHALSLVNFSAKNVSTGAIYTIEKVELKNLGNSASLNPVTVTWNNPTPASLIETYVAGIPAYKPTGVDGTFGIGGITILPKGATATDFQSLMGPNEGMMVLPQVLEEGEGHVDGVLVEPLDIATAGKVYVVVTFHASDMAGDVINEEATKAYFPLTLTLEPKKAYDFQITLGEDDVLVPITFDVASVTDWTTPAINQPIPMPVVP